MAWRWATEFPNSMAELFTRDKSVILRGVGFSFDLSSIVLVRPGSGAVADGRSIVFGLRRNTRK